MPTTHSGFMVQNQVGHFELVTPSEKCGMAHVWRDNAAPFPWSAPKFFGCGVIQEVSLILSNFGAAAGRLEVVTREGNRLAHYYRHGAAEEPALAWYGPFYFATNVSGSPALIQGNFGNKGNFELVVPVSGGGLAHYSRNNDAAEPTWGPPTPFGQSAGVINAAALLQTNAGVPGNLEVIARAGSQLLHFWREASVPFVWHGPTVIPLVGLPAGAAPTGVPAFTQGSGGNVGNFELIVPLTTGSLVHLWRNNDDPALSWSGATVFAAGLGQVDAVSLIESKLGNPPANHLEIGARSGYHVVHLYRGDPPAFEWSGPTATAYLEPTVNPPVEGEWRVPFSSEVVGVHAALLNTGKVLLFSYEEHEEQQHGDSCIIDPLSGTMQTVHIEKNLFCAGHAFLADGRLLVAGGSSSGINALHAFTPSGDAGAWQDLGAMSGGDRWYPTCTLLPDGRMFIISGGAAGGGPTVNPHTCELVQPVNDTYELFDPVSGVKPAVQAQLLNDGAPYTLYPFVFVLPSGTLLIHANTSTWFLDPTNGNVDPNVLSTVSSTARTYPSEGTCVLLPLLPTENPPYRPRILLIGGAGASCPTPAQQDTPATNTCEILEFGLPSLGWKPAPPMSQPRVMPDAVILADGTVLVMNGSSTGVADNGIDPVLQTELYNPETSTWTAMCPMRVPRLYHSTALLLPDGRVLTAGKDEEFNPEEFHYPEYRLEVFSPPYLFRGPRPEITAAPAQIGYGAAFDVETPNGANIDSAALVRPGAVTHSFNMEQRYVGLTITGHAPGQITLEAPPHANIAPPGFYMLFMLNSNGVPSVAHFLHVS